MIKTLILGSGAGGGFPQWNCRCANCLLYWQGDARVQQHTQSSIAVSADGESWTIINCSPDLKQQIVTNRELHPKSGKRSSPINSVVITNGDIDHIAGLLNLREGQTFALYASHAIHKILLNNDVFNVLSADKVKRLTITPDKTESVNGLKITPFMVPGKVPLYLETEQVVVDQLADTTIGLEIVNGDKRLVYIPGCSIVTEEIIDRVNGVDILLFDGTVYNDDELEASGVGHKTGYRMGHLQMYGDKGSIEMFSDANVKRKMFIHINNTNPVLVEKSPERLAVEAAKWEIAYDGMRFNL